jgi:hypothetical protein
MMHKKIDKDVAETLQEETIRLHLAGTNEGRTGIEHLRRRVSKKAGRRRL